MATQYVFTRCFQNLVEKQLRELLPKSYQIDGETPLSSKNIYVVVDLQIKTTNKLYLIEYEIHRVDPSNNIAKIAYWLQTTPFQATITVIQFFSPHYEIRNGQRSSKQLISEYLGQELITNYLNKTYITRPLTCMKKGIFEHVYTSFPKGKTPPSEVINQLHKIANETTDQIQRIVS